MGSTTAISVAKALRAPGAPPLRIVGTDIHEPCDTPGAIFADALHRVPPAASGGLAPALLDVCAREGVRIVFPVVDAEVREVARARDAFARAGVLACTGDAWAVEVCGDKLATAEHLRRAGFATPRTWRGEGLDPGRLDAPFPLVVKPADGVSSNHVRVVTDLRELEAALRAVPNPVVQEYLEGPEFTVDVLSGWDGKSLAAVPRERLEVKAGISVKGRTFRHPALERAALGVADALGMRGACNVQGRLGPRGPAFFEVNPRFSAGLPLTVAAGLNGPRLLVEAALGRAVAPERLAWRAGVSMVRYWQEGFFADGRPIAPYVGD
jgi:carbamoyl-phosphate synthase large subunit